MELETSLNQVKKNGGWAYTLFQVFFFTCLAYTAIVLILAMADLLAPGMLAISSSFGWFALLAMAVHAIPFLAIVKLVANMLRDVSKGETPFSLKQVKRIRWIALLILADVILSALFSPGVIGMISAGTLDMGYMATSQTSNFVSINVSELFFAGVLLCLSLVFQYGMLLQKFSDETL